MFTIYFLSILIIVYYLFIIVFTLFKLRFLESMFFIRLFIFILFLYIVCVCMHVCQINYCQFLHFQLFRFSPYFVLKCLLYFTCYPLQGTVPNSGCNLIFQFRIVFFCHLARLNLFQLITKETRFQLESSVNIKHECEIVKLQFIIIKIL